MFKLKDDNLFFMSPMAVKNKRPLKFHKNGGQFSSSSKREQFSHKN